MRDAQPEPRTGTVGPPLWTVPLAMLLCGLFAVAVGSVGALTGGWLGNAPKERALRITGNGLLQQRPDGPIVLCLGASGESRPAVCSSTVALTGVTWHQVPNPVDFNGTTEGWASLTGTWSNGVLQVSDVAPPRLVTPVPVQATPDQLCIEAGGSASPTKTHTAPDPALLTSIPGYQGDWVTDGGTPSGGDGTVSVHNVAVRGDVAQATRLIRQQYDGPLCVGTIPGATHAELTSAMAQLSASTVELGLLDVHTTLAGGESGLDLDVFVVTPEIKRSIDAMVGPEVAPWLTVRGQFQVID